MSGQERDELARRLEGIVRAVPGVVAVYRSGPLLAGLAPDAPAVRVEEAAGARRVRVVVGVAGRPAAEACRAVHDALAAVLSPGDAVEVTVAYVAG